MQTVLELVDGRVERLVIPHPEHELLPGLRWGLATALFTPAYWVAQLWHSSWNDGYREYAWSGNLRHEIVACLLGGHGITYEMNRAAFERLRDRGLLDIPQIETKIILQALTEPFLRNGRPVRYRFPRQKCGFVHAALARLDRESPPSDLPAMFRNWLVGFPGIGLKTASWITRNALRTREVAVIDVHICRAGIIMGLFSGSEKLPKDYLSLERRFLHFSSAIGADPRRLDLLMWWQMRESGYLAFDYLRKAAA